MAPAILKGLKKDLIINLPIFTLSLQWRCWATPLVKGIKLCPSCSPWGKKTNMILACLFNKYDMFETAQCFIKGKLSINRAPEELLKQNENRFLKYNTSRCFLYLFVQLMYIQLLAPLSLV